MLHSMSISGLCSEQNGAAYAWRCSLCRPKRRLGDGAGFNFLAFYVNMVQGTEPFHSANAEVGKVCASLF